MRKVHLVLRLFFAAGLSIRAIARSINASPSTVGTGTGTLQNSFQCQISSPVSASYPNKPGLLLTII